MKDLKIITLFALLIVLFSCSSDDESSESNNSTNCDFVVIGRGTGNGNQSVFDDNDNLIEIECITCDTGFYVFIVPSDFFDFENDDFKEGGVPLSEWQARGVSEERFLFYQDDNNSSCFNETALNNELQLQTRLSNGESPLEIYNSDNNNLEKLYGLTYEGGLIFHLNTSNGETLISSQSDQSKEAEWGCEGVNINNAESTNIGAGLTNTEAIVENCNTQGIAANLCLSLVSNGKDDWYLPSKDELNLMYVNLKSRSLGNFDNKWYWSSTEFEDQANFNSTGFEAVWVQSFEDGAKVTYDVGIKRFKNNVRAIRKTN